jgi:hypothetical protein
LPNNSENAASPHHETSPNTPSSGYAMSGSGSLDKNFRGLSP